VKIDLDGVEVFPLLSTPTLNSFCWIPSVMKILDSFAALPKNFGPCVLTLGNFDGVHLGHRELFRRLNQLSKEQRCSSVVCTFNPHPLKFLCPDKAPPLINTIEEKRRLIASSKVDYLLEIPFTHEFSSIAPEHFVDDILLGKLQVRSLVVGYDYAFGKGRSGNADFLQSYGASRGLSVEVLQPVGADGQPYSSTRVRNYISAGQVADVISLLGRQYTFEGKVVPGDKRGREIGFPTANIKTDKELLPAIGVYAVKVRYKSHIYNGVVSIGFRPTFSGNFPTIEVYLMDFEGDLYGQSLRLYFVERLRDELKFTAVDALIEAITNDVIRAREILKAARVIEYREYLSKL